MSNDTSTEITYTKGTSVRVVAVDRMHGGVDLFGHEGVVRYQRDDVVFVKFADLGQFATLEFARDEIEAI